MTEAHPSDSRFVLVPREPTQAMIEAGKRRLGDTATAVWSAMLSAAPGGEGEPVAWTGSGSLARIKGRGQGFQGYIYGSPDAAHPIPLFTAPPEPVAWRPTHRHAGRGGEYQVIGTATVQTTEGLCDYDTVTLYRDTEGLTWARHIDEFNDGRFVALPEAPLQAKEGV